MNTAPIFDTSLLGMQPSKINLNYWQGTLDHFERRKYYESFIGVLNYVDKDIVKKRGNDSMKPTEFVIPHGSFHLSISLKNGICSIKAPFLTLPQKSAIPLLRQIMEINFSVLVLSQITLHGNQLFFEFECPLELCEPFKIYSVLEEICTNGDFYDDLFIEKFGAKHIEQQKISPLSAKDKEKAWKKFQEYLKELFQYINFFENKRLMGFAWDTLLIQLMKIDYFMAPQGFLRSEIEQCILDMNNDKLPLNDVMEKGKIAVKKLMGFDRKKFDKYLYNRETFVPSKKRCDLGCVQNMLKKDYERAKNEISSGGHMGATLSLLYGIYYLYYGNEIPVEQRKILNRGLKNAGGKTWKIAAESLWKEVTIIMQTKTDDGSKL